MIPLRILLIEDDGLIGLMLGELLQELGHAICGIATTEADAVAAAARCRPDLMIVHARLAAGSGISAVATILRNGHVAHLFTSGGHGFGLRRAMGKPAEAWPELFAHWAQTQGLG